MPLYVQTEGMMATNFQATEADLVAGYRLHFLDSIKRKRALRAFVVVAVVCALVSTWLLWSDDIGPIVAALVGLVYGFGLLAIILVINFLMLPRRVRRIFAQQKSLHGETHVEWSDAGISFRSAHGHSTLEWSDYVRLVEGRDMILLMQSDALFNFIPKSALTAEQAAGIMAFK